MRIAITARFRQLVADLTDEESFFALMFHIRECSKAGFCPVCSGNLIPDPDIQCVYGPGCLHGLCDRCGHCSHYDPGQEPQSVTPRRIRTVRATLDEMIRLMDAGHMVAVRRLKDSSP